MKKTPIKKTKQEEMTLSVKFYLNGEVHEFNTNNILEAFRGFKIEPRLLKTALKLEVSYMGAKPYMRILNMPRVRTFVVNDVLKQIIAKQFGVAIGAPITSYTNG